MSMWLRYLAELSIDLFVAQHACFKQMGAKEDKTSFGEGEKGDVKKEISEQDEFWETEDGKQTE